MGLWDRRDTGTTTKGGSTWDVLRTPGGTVGQTGHWDNHQGWEYLGCPEDSRWDCGTGRTLGQLPRVGVLGMSQGLPMGLWDRQDTGTTAIFGSPWDVLRTPSGTVGQTGHWDKSTTKGGSSWDVLRTPDGTVGQTGH